MNITSLFGKNTRTNNRSRNLLKRSLRIEALEARQLLTVAMDMGVDGNDDLQAPLGADVPAIVTTVALGADSDELEPVLNAQNRQTINSTADTNYTSNWFSNNDNTVTLREALSRAENGNTITFDGITGTSVTINLINDKDVKIAQSCTLDAGDKDIVINYNNESEEYDPFYVPYGSNGWRGVDKVTDNVISFKDSSIKLTLAASDGGSISVYKDGALFASVGVEEAELPSTTVTTLDDVVDDTDDLISLREAIAAAGNDDLGSTVTFADGLTGEINLTAENGSLVINKNILIEGDDITINAPAEANIFNETDGGFVQVSEGITLNNRYEIPSTIVDTLESSTKTDGKTSLAEAIINAGDSYRNYYNSSETSEITLPDTVTFAEELNGTITGSFNTEAEVTIDGTDAITLDGNGGQLFVEEGDYVYVTGGIKLQNYTLNGSEIPSITVTTLNDIVDNTDGLISLREAIAYSGTEYRDYYNPEYYSTLGSTIFFSNDLAGEINLTAEKGTLVINKNILIDGTGITINAAKDANIFTEKEDGFVQVTTGITLNDRYEIPSTVVTTGDDVIEKKDKEISFREALNYAGTSYRNYYNPSTAPQTTLGTTVTFDENLEDAIELNSSLNLGDGQTISGDGQIINGNNNELNVPYEAATVLEGLTLNNLHISNSGSLTLNNVEYNTGSVNNSGSLTLNGGSLNDSDLSNYGTLNTGTAEEDNAPEFNDTSINNQTGGFLTLGGTFENTTFTNYGTLSVDGATFTGEYQANRYQTPMFMSVAMDVNDGYGDAGYGDSVNFDEYNVTLLSNYGGLLTVSNTVFKDITVDVTDGEIIDHDNISVNLTLIYNGYGEGFNQSQEYGLFGGELIVNNVQIYDNASQATSIHGDSSATFVAIDNDAVSDAPESMIQSVPNLVVNRVLAFNNTATAATRHGDVFAGAAAVINSYGNAAIYNSMFYDNAAKTKIGLYPECLAEDSSFGIYTEWENITVTNSTILDGIGSYRGDIVMNNTIYSDFNGERGWIVSESMAMEEGGIKNVTTTEMDLADIFAFYNDGTFLNGDGVRDYRIWANNTGIVDAGDNDKAATMGNFAGMDLLGNDRIINDVVDIGAVESDAVRIDADDLALNAKAADGEEGLTTIYTDWVPVDSEGTFIEYEVQIRTSAVGAEGEDGYIAAGEWSESVVIDSIDDVIVGEDGRYYLAFTGLTADTWYDFQIKALGDNISFLDSDWSDPATAKTKVRLEVVNPWPAAQSTTEINVGWMSQAKEQSYVLRYRQNGTNPETNAAYDWTTLDLTKAEANVNEQENWCWYLVEDLQHSTLYDFQLKAVGNQTEYLDSNWSNVFSTRTMIPLDVPEITGATVRTTSAITVTWGSVSNAVGYTVEYAEETTDPNDRVWKNATVTTNSFGLNKLPEGTDYVFRVQSNGNELYQTSGFGDIYTTSTLVQLDAPTVSATPVFVTEFTTDTISIDLTVDDRATNSALEYRIANSGNDWQTATLDGDGNLTDLAAGTTYEFRARALGDNSDPSNIENWNYADSTWTLTTATTPTALDTPVIELTGKTTSTLTVSWDAVENAQGYILTYTGADDPILLNSTDTTYTLNNLGEAESVTFTIYASGIPTTGTQVYASSASSTVTGVTQYTLATPVEVTAKAVAGSTNSIQVTWTDETNDPDDVDGYKLQYRVAQTGTVNPWSIFTGAITDMSAVIDQLADGTTYEFQVTALGNNDTSVDSVPSATATAATLKTLSAPAPIATATGSNSITVTWNGVEDATGYTLEQFVDGAWTAVFENQNITTQTIDDLAADTTYTFRVNAHGEASVFITPSVWSDEVSATTWAELVAPVLAITEDSVTTNSAELNWTTTDSNEDIGSWTLEMSTNGTDWTTYATDIAPETRTQSLTGLVEGTTYLFRITAEGINNVSVDSPVSNIASVLTKTTLNRVSDLIVSATGTTTIDATWQSVDNADSYIVTWYLGEDLVGTDTVDTTTVEITDLTHSTEYKVSVIATSDDTNYVDSAAVSDVATTWVQLPAPTNLDTTDTTMNSITITWDVVAPETFNSSDTYTTYELQYRAADTETWSAPVTVTESATPGWKVDGLTSGTSYNFQVRVIGIDGVSATSDWSGTFTSDTLTQLATPVLDGDNDGARKAQLVWPGVDNATSYDLFISTDQVNWNVPSEFEIYGSDSMPQAGVSGLTPDTTYYFKVVAKADGFADSEPSNVLEIKTDDILPLDTPIDITAQTVDYDTINVSWEQVEGAVSYDVKVYLNEELIDTINVAGNLSAVDVNGLTAGTTYEFSVTAIASSTDDNFKDSAESDLVSATTDKKTLNTPAPAVTIVNDGLSVTWTAVDEATSYTIQYRLNGADETTEWTTPANGTGWTNLTFVITGLDERTAYDVRVQANADPAQYQQSDWGYANDFTTLGQIGVEGIIVKEANKSELDATTKPTSPEWVDEWMNLYLELWTEDTEQLVGNREVSITVEIHENYSIGTMDAFSGLTVTKVDGTDNLYTFTVAISDEYALPVIATDTESTSSENTVSAVMLGQIQLIPQGVIPVGTPEDQWTEAVTIDEVGYVPVRDVPFDLDDNGMINGSDYGLFGNYQKISNSLVDYDGNGIFNTIDWKMLNQNNSKVVANTNGKGEIDYSVPSADQEVELPEALAAPALASTMYVAEASELTVGDYTSEFTISLSTTEKDALPYHQEENRMTGGVILKSKSARKAEEDEAAANAQTVNDAVMAADELWAMDEDDIIDLRYAA